MSLNFKNFKFGLADYRLVEILHGNVMGHVVAFCIRGRFEVLGHDPGVNFNCCHVVVDFGVVCFAVTAIFPKSFCYDIAILHHHH